MDTGIKDRDLSSRIAQLSPAKRALLELKLSQSGGRNILPRTIPRRPTRDSAPLSFAQQRLWFLNQLEPESAAYNEATALRLQGDLDVDALRQALNAIVERHQVLRTTIELDNGGNVIQVIGNPPIVDLPIFNLQRNPESDVQQVIVQIRNQPFNLSEDLMLRATLLKTGADEHILLVVRHHIASDGWSSGVFFQEFAALYRASVKGQPNPLSPLPIQYADYAVWQRQWLQGEELEKQVAFWKEQLRDLPALELPTDRPRPPMQTHRGARKSLVLPASLSERLTALSHRENATLFMTLLAAFQVLLHRYSGQDDIAVGSPIAGRTRIETEGLIGFFVNTLVFRTDLSGNPTFKELLARVRQVALQAYEHQDLPFEKLVEELNPDRDRSRSPLFQVVFAMQNMPRRIVDLPGIIATPVEVALTTAKFDLSAAFIERDGSQTLRIEYDTDLFNDETIERMLGHFQNLLEAIASKPESRLSELPILKESERRQILIEWNETQREYPQGCVHELFERQVECTPDAIAVSFENEQLTYRELNHRSNQLAHYLRKLGVGPEVLVGVCLERSLELVVALLGVLKAGGAYVPLDPGYPAERRELMLTDARVLVLLSYRSLEDTAGRSDHGHRRTPFLERPVRWIDLDVDWDLIAGESDANPEKSATADNLAYVIYTSGSTGLPKGVQITHASLLNLVFWHHQAFSISASDRATQLAGPGFDAAVWELWPYLARGASIHIPDEVMRLDAALLQKWLISRAITISFVPTALVESLLTLDWPQQAALRILLTGGDTLNTYPAEDLKFAIFNNYGPTECTVVATSGEILSNRDGAHRPTIGRPISNTQIYILDGQLQPVPIGVAGELHIGGAGLARGYLNRPELTAEKFIANPFSEDPSARLYKTGDRARYLPSGDIEFLGRFDDQVKIRGFRIELGEIEAALGQISSVQDVAVLVREDVPEDRRLVAYVVAAPGFNPSAGELRAEIQQRLPEYMVPANFVFLQALPVNRNGKLDRRALPLPDQNSRAIEQEFVAPRTPIEEILTNIWGGLLKLDKVGVHDNFFQLGGHSLLATQAVSRINNAFGIGLPLLQFFESPTIAALAASIESLMARSEPNGNPSIVTARRQDAPLSFAQQRLWFLNQLEPENCAYNEIRAHRLDGNLNVEALRGALNAIVERHEVLRTWYAISDEGEPVQRVGAPEAIELPVLDISALQAIEQDAEVRRRALDLRARPFDLANDMPLRLVLLRLSARSHVLLEVMHHIATDGWSGAVFARELAALYERLDRGDTTPLPELPLQYADYAAWQRQWLQGETFERQVAFWRAELRDLPVLELPTDRPRPAVQTYRGARQSLVLSQLLSDRLNALSRRENATLFMTLLAAFQVFLHRYSDQDDIAVGSPIAGRTRVETEGLIGCFVNTLVYRNHVSGEQRFTEFLARVREGALKAYAHQELPFEKLVEELNPERSLNHSPLFQVLFALQNMPRQNLTMPELTASSLEVGPVTAKFDLFASFGVRDGQLLLRMEYDAELFDAGTIERMLGHCRVLLEGIVADPDRRIADLPLLTEAEEHQLLVEWKGAQADRALCGDVVSIFEKQVERTPNARALSFDDASLTYAELNRRANQLAHYLIRRGVRSETHVAIYLERSVESAIGLLAVLKAGGVYVPLDPSYPRGRIAQMAQDLNAPFLVSTEALRSRLPALGAPAILLDAERENIAREAQTNLHSTKAAESAAYALYTSGSTGKAKGVVMSRGALGNLISWQIENLSEPSAARTLQFAPCGFDVSIQEMLTTWCCGGSLFLIADEVRRDGQRLLEFLKEQSIERVFLPFVALQNLAEAAAYGDGYPPSLREIITAGEQLQMTASLRSLLRRLGDCCLRNQYGPTETHVATEFVLKPPFVDAADLPPIGRPIANAEIYILDSRHNPVPIGVPGEIFVGGNGLARGYLNQPELTAEKFIDWSFHGGSVARLYKTGDRGRYLPDGNIEFLGRLDRQVKVRGFRIELGEVEAALARCPGVHSSAVALEAAPTDKRLVAYLVMHEGASVGSQELRAYLKEKLPDYMVPSAFVFLDAMPLTASGKLDRARLPAPQFSQSRTYVAPRTPVEEKLAAVWSEMLRLDRVGVHEDFFDLGGHSLLATRLASRIKEVFGIELALRTVFELPTVAGLSGHIEAIGWTDARNSTRENSDQDQTEEIIL